MLTMDIFYLAVSVLLIASLLTVKASPRLLPVLFIVFLAGGMAAGFEGPGGIYFYSPYFAKSIAFFMLIAGVFYAGVSLQKDSYRQIATGGILLGIIGYAASVAVITLLAQFMLNLELKRALVLGAVIAVTDPIGSNAMRLKQSKTDTLTSLEAGISVALAVFATLGFVDYATLVNRTIVDLGAFFLVQSGLGIVIGFVLGIGFVSVVNRINFRQPGLYIVFFLVYIMLAFALSSVLGGNGILAVLITGIFASMSSFVHRRSAIAFFEGLNWIGSLTAFILLGLIVVPSQLLDGIGAGIGFAVAALLVSITIAFVILLFSPLSPKQRIVAALSRSKGSANILLSTLFMIPSFSRPEQLLNIVFTVILFFIIYQAFVLPLLVSFFSEEKVDKDQGRLVLSSLTMPVGGKKVAELSIPGAARIAMIGRGDTTLIPDGNTELREGDSLQFVCSEEDIKPLTEYFDSFKQD